MRDKVNTLAVQVGESAQYVERVMHECGDVSEGAMDALSKEVANLEGKRTKLEELKEEVLKQASGMSGTVLVSE